jgi:Lrp/AsnC family transcriptional regulator for asnA, asnC and gidA
VDGADLKIVASIKSEGRKSYADIARETGLTEATVRRRLRQLLDDGVISIVVMPEPARIGLPVHVLFRLQVELDRLESVTLALTDIPNVRWVGIVTGDHNVILEAFFASNGQMNRVMTGRLAKIAGITHLEVQTVLELVSRTYNWETMGESASEPGKAPEATAGATTPSPTRATDSRRNF